MRYRQMELQQQQKSPMPKQTIMTLNIIIQQRERESESILDRLALMTNTKRPNSIPLYYCTQTIFLIINYKAMGGQLAK